MIRYLSVILACLTGTSVSQVTSVSLDSRTILERTKAATVIVLTGDGAGRLRSTGTGVIISKDGTILTALHLVKDAAEVQVRLANGEVFDHVELAGVDERRDVAALKIPASQLPTITVGESAAMSVGSAVFAVSNADGLNWSATEGIISSLRSADEIPGAGSGFRIVQFSNSVSPGSSGGALVDNAGRLIGLITSKRGAAGFAVPIESVAGLGEGSRRTAFGSGALLQLPSKMAADVPQSSAAITGADPKRILSEAKTICVQSKTSFLTVDTLDRALTQQKAWPKLGLVIVQDPRVADLLIQIDRPLFTYVHTFVILDKRTSIILGSGKQTAFDGTIASGGLAKDIVRIFVAAKLPDTNK